MNFSREAGFIVFRVLIPLVIFATQYVLFRRTERWFRTHAPRAKAWRLVARTLFVLFNAAFVYIFLQRPGWQYPSPWYVQAGWFPFYLWHGTSFFIGLFLLIMWIIRSPFRLGLWIAKKIPPARKRLETVRSMPRVQTFDSARRTFLRRGMYGLAATSLGGNAYGMLLEKNECDITSTEFAIRGLPLPLDGFTIALVSDIHSSVFMLRKEMERYASLVNSLHADLIVVPGDFVTSYVSEVYPFTEAFHVLSAPYGVYGVLGNHDFYAGADTVAREVDACGIKMLRDDKVLIEKNGGSFYLLGVDDVGVNNRAPIKLDQTIGSAPDRIPRILLCHRPYYLKDAAERNIDLVLSGHTHGGQVVLGRFGNVVLAPSSIASPYVSGRYSEGNTQMYVSRGIGTVGLPLRINCPPEITRITLRRV